MFRIIEGAVNNAWHAHPRWPFDPRFAKSISKRAVGTLSAALPEVLAAHTPSAEPGDDAVSDRHRDQGPQAIVGPEVEGAAVSLSPRRRSPLLKLHMAVGKMAARAKRDGKDETVDALIKVLQLIGYELKPRRRGRAFTKKMIDSD